MNRKLTALFAAFEALLVVAIGIAIPLVPLTLMWAIQYGLAIDWTAFWRAAVDIWLLGHGVDLVVTLDPVTAAALQFPTAGDPFTLGIAALGFALLTALLGVRAGRRVAEAHHAVLGQLVSLGAFALASFGATFSAVTASAQPSLVQGALLPTGVFAIGLVIGVRRSTAEPVPTRAPIGALLGRLRPDIRTTIVTALRGGAAAAASVIALAAVFTGLAILVAYARIISLYESLHTEVLGGIAVTLGQLAFLPNLVVFTMSWLVGPGFELGSGSFVSPLASQLGPVPAIPVLGALPSGELPFGFLGLLVPVIAGFLTGAVLGPRVRHELGVPAMAASALGMGLVGGVILGLLAWAASGSAGPGRLVDVGADPWAVGGWAALELGLAALVGLFASLRIAPAKASGIGGRAHR